MKSVRIVYQITARSGILIGSTADALGIGIDRTTTRRRRVGKGATQEPLIPGSTLKGKIRNECERILTALGYTVCHAPGAAMMCPHDPQVAKPPCPVCCFLGGPGFQSRLFFSDAVARADDHIASYLMRVQAGVALSRKRRTAEDERLYYTQRGVEGIVYQAAIDGSLDDASTNQQLALILAAIERLVALGGGKSRGGGWITTRIITVTIDGKDVNETDLTKIREEGLKAWRESK